MAFPFLFSGNSKLVHQEVHVPTESWEDWERALMFAANYVTVTVISESRNSRSWRMSKEQLRFNSGYFRTVIGTRTYRVDISDMEPETFVFFVAFVHDYRLQYHFPNNDFHIQVRDSVKAWILGDYLDAAGFKEFTMKRLHHLYPPTGFFTYPDDGVGPEIILYISENSTTYSVLSRLLRVVLVRDSTQTPIISVDRGCYMLWNHIWTQCSVFIKD